MSSSGQASRVPLQIGASAVSRGAQARAARTGDGPASPLAEGLSSDAARARLARDGPNEITREAPTPVWRLVWAQLASPVIALLGAACVATAVAGEVVDAIAIGAIVLINAAVGFFQEHRAEKAIFALRSMTAPRARVLRDGHAAEIPAAEVVEGDLLLLDAGDRVAADARLLEAHALTTQEAALTGESVPVDKSSAPTAPGAPMAERTDAVFMGTAVASGSGRATVVATGMRTELGKIAHLISTAEVTATPLQTRLAGVSRVLLWACGGVVVVVAVIGLARGLPLTSVLMSAVSLAVAAVPEGLPAIVTIALAIGVQRMAAHHVLVRRLPAVETLGSTTVICTDKTGTLTTGEMRVRALWGPDADATLDAAAACSDAELAADAQGGVGDPTEVALLIAAAERGIQRADLERTRPRVAVHPFDARDKRMSIARADGALYVKGALESLLPLCDQGTEGATEANADLASRGLRVLAVARGRGHEHAHLTLLGLVGIADPPRPEAIAAIRDARAAGIHTVMITGDHPTTAAAIARELGIVAEGESAVDRVHARATPEAKLEIVRAWKRSGAVVAMTGDGVNDAPALEEAHVGVAMGRTGTEVAREAADIVLSDDNFASIVRGVHEGRATFDNIRKALVYLLVGNIAELGIMLGASIVGAPLPLLPLHLLWINLVTDGLPALALVMEPAAADAMHRPPRPATEPILGRHQWRYIAFAVVLEAGVTLGVFAWGLSALTLPEARGLAFATLVFSELFRAFTARSPTRVFFGAGALSNPRLLAAVGVTLIAQLAILGFDATRSLFDVGALSWSLQLFALGAALIPVSMLELAKLLRRR